MFLSDLVSHLVNRSRDSAFEEAIPGGVAVKVVFRHTFKGHGLRIGGNFGEVHILDLVTLVATTTMNRNFSDLRAFQL